VHVWCPKRWPAAKKKKDFSSEKINDREVKLQIIQFAELFILLKLILY